MGINVKAVKIKAFMFVGLGAAIAGIFTTLITYTFFPTQGFGYLLLALAAVFVGGTPYWGGLGTIIGARIMREGELLEEGLINSLKRHKDDIKEVKEGLECGIGVEGIKKFKEGDIIGKIVFGMLKN